MATKNKQKAKTYKWGGKSFSVPAQIVGEELQSMFPNGNAPPREVLESARDPQSVLHPCFEWDDDRAAEAYRLDQARQLVRSIIVVRRVGEQTEKRYAYVHVTDQDGPRYVDVDRVASDEEIREAAITEALAQLEGMRRRYNFIAELRPVFAAADAASRKIKKKRKAS